MDVFKMDKLGNLNSLQDNDFGASVKKTSQDLAYIEEQVRNAQRAIREGNSKIYNDAVSNIVSIVESMRADEGKRREDYYYNLKLQHKKYKDAEEVLKKAGFKEQPNGQFKSKETGELAEIKERKDYFQIVIYDKTGKVMAG